MATIAQYTDAFVQKWNGRKVSLDGEDLNADGRFGIQCMDLWLKFRYGLGHTAWLATPDAASVWELNSQPGLPMWRLWDAITPDKPAQKGDQFIMNRHFFNNGVGHIGTVLADLGSSIRVLETNGLGDGYEDQYMNQYGSPARIHDWPKTNLYGYLRWIGPVPATASVNAVVPAGDAVTQLQEEDMTPEQAKQLAYISSPQFKADIFTGKSPVEVEAQNAFIDRILTRDFPWFGFDGRVPASGRRTTTLATDNGWGDAREAGNTRTILARIDALTAVVAKGANVDAATLKQTVEDAVKASFGDYTVTIQKADGNG